MIKVIYESGKLEGFLKELVEEQSPFALSLTMRKAQHHANDTIRDSMMMGGIKGGPTSFTLRGLRNNFPTKDNLESHIFYPPSHSYMREIIYGGTKRAKNQRLPEPIMDNIGKDLTGKGNISRRVFKSGNLVGGNKSKRYFIGGPKGVPNTPGNRGVGRRDGKSGYEGDAKNRKARGRIVQIVNLGRSAREQRITFPANRIAMEAYRTGISRNFSFAMKRAIETAKKKL